MTGSQFSDLKISEGGCWEREGGFFQKGLLIKKMFLSVITKNLNWAILTKNLVCRFKDGGRGDLTKKEGVVFLRGVGLFVVFLRVDTLMQTMNLAITLTVVLIY